MHERRLVAASFDVLGQATGAVDWFRNQGTDPDAILIAAVAPGEKPRAPQRGDNRRTDLRWIVALDLAAAPVAYRQAADTLQREGGALMAELPARLWADVEGPDAPSPAEGSANGGR
jgi:hypothetical protein